jgi:hypothetical protein
MKRNGAPQAAIDAKQKELDQLRGIYTDTLLLWNQFGDLLDALDEVLTDRYEALWQRCGRFTVRPVPGAGSP